MHNFKELKIWQRSMSLAEEIYKISKQLPKDELYGISFQIRKCAVSVPSNIAEGRGRNSNPQLIQFLQIAQGSLCELECQLLLIESLQMAIVDNDLFKEISEIQKMMRTFGASKRLKN